MPAVGRTVIERARGREAEGPGPQPFRGEFGHAPSVLLGGGLAVGAALAHHIDPQGSVRHLSRDIGIVGTCGNGIEEIREAVPVPRQSFAQHDFGNVLHALHQVDQHVVLILVAGREADAAIAEQHGRGAGPRGRRQPVAPGHLCIVMRVNVDEARRDELAACVDLLGALGNAVADGRDPAVDREKIRLIGIATRTIDDRAVADHQAGTGHAKAPWRG